MILLDLTIHLWGNIGRGQYERMTPVYEWHGFPGNAREIMGNMGGWRKQSWTPLFSWFSVKEAGCLLPVPAFSFALYVESCSWMLHDYLFPLRTYFRSRHLPLPYHTRSLDHQKIHQVRLYNNPYLFLNHYLTMNPFWSFLPPVARPSFWLPSCGIQQSAFM